MPELDGSLTPEEKRRQQDFIKSKKLDKKFFLLNFLKIKEDKEVKIEDEIGNIFTEDIDDGRIITNQIPFRFLRGRSSVDKGGFFDAKLLTSNDQFSVVKLKNPDTGESSLNYVGLRFDRFKLMVKAFIDNQASSTAAATQLSASFFGPGKMGSLLSDSDFLTLIEEDNSEIESYDEHKGDGELTSNDVQPRFILRSAGSDNQSTGIVNSDGFIDIEFKNTASYATNATFSFAPGGALGEIHQSGYTSSWAHRFFNTGSNHNGIALSGSESGAIRGIGVVKFVNNENSLDGRYSQFLIKSRIYGDGNYQLSQDNRSDFGTPNNFIFVPIKEIIVYENSITVTSGSFKYNSSSAAAASSSGTSVTLFYQSGSNGPSGSFTGSNVNQGSHIYLNVNLTTPASSGYYAEPGTHNVLHAFRGGLTNDVIGSEVGGTIEYQIPRFVSRSIGPF
jgi:hypothetical protein